jgi:hypothetical protein
MMPPISVLARQLSGLPCRELLISRLDVIRDTIIRIETRLTRANGTYVDLFIDTGARGSAGLDALILSDFGTTWDYILDSGASLDRFSLEYIAQSYGLQLDGQALSKTCTIDNFLPGVLALGQACVAMSMPGLSQRQQMIQVMRDRELVSAPLPASSTLLTVVDTLTRSRRSFDQDVPIQLRELYEVHVDILVRTQRRPAAMMVVEHSPYEKVTMRRADHAFAIHTDLKEARWRGMRLSIVDEADFERESFTDSFVRLGRVSKIISTSDLQREDFELVS